LEVLKFQTVIRTLNQVDQVAEEITREVLVQVTQAHTLQLKDTPEVQAQAPETAAAEEQAR
jgi:hypothetical protein